MATYVPRSIEEISQAFLEKVQEQRIAQQLVEKELIAPAPEPAPIPDWKPLVPDATPAAVEEPPAVLPAPAPIEEPPAVLPAPASGDETPSLDQINSQFIEARTDDVVQPSVQAPAPEAPIDAIPVADAPVAVAPIVSTPVPEEPIAEPAAAEPAVVVSPVAETLVAEALLVEASVETDEALGEGVPVTESVVAEESAIDEPFGEVGVHPHDTVPIAVDAAAQVAAFDTLKDTPTRSSWWRKLLRFLGILLWILTVLGLVLSAIGFLTRSNPVTTIGNFGMYYQRTTDMAPDIENGSLVITRMMQPDEGALGDDIIFALNENDSLESVVLRRVVNVLRASDSTTYDTIALADRENTHEQFDGKNALMKKMFRIPLLGLLIDQLTVNVWWVIGLFLLSLVLVSAFRPEKHHEHFE